MEAPGYGLTQRKDAWWVAPLVQGSALACLILYATVVTLLGSNFEWGPYLSPIYSPLFQPDWWPLSPAILIMWIPIGVRGTCYYYRKAYYRAYFMHPPACAVHEPWKADYGGETRFPFIVMNLHRYLIYIGFIPLATMWYDVYLATRFEGGFGVGVGTLVLLVNVSCISMYVFSCHVTRHLIGGGVDCFAKAWCGKQRHTLWKAASAANEHHMLYAWLSFVSVTIADLYVRLGAMGYIPKDFDRLF